MQNIFLDSRILDKNARESFFLTEDIMMENAAAGLEKAVVPHVFHESGRYISRPCVLILAGRGNNGADGFALARRLVCRDFSVAVCCSGEPSGEIARIQKKRAESAGVSFLSFYDLDSFIEEKSFDISVVVDCLYGSGFHLPLDCETEAVIQAANSIEAFKIACDVPSGLDFFGNGGIVFRADETVTMGALKLSLFSDRAKDLCGKITVCGLGVSRNNFESAILSDAYLLEKSEMELPFRKKQNVHKGTFGHVSVVLGEKKGAAEIVCSAAFSFGAGLVSVAGVKDNVMLDMDIMSFSRIPENANAVVFGPGLGRENSDVEEYIAFLTCKKNISCVIDADAFYYNSVIDFIKDRKQIILTPHPREFSVLLSGCGLGKYTVEEVVENRFELVKLFCTEFKNCVLLLKGAVVTIGKWSAEESRVRIYLNPAGTNALAKGGSGDVLSGLAAALLAQGYNCINAAITASLAHSFASAQIKNNYALTPQILIEKISGL